MYMRPPQGYRTNDENGTPLVWHLNTPLYGQGKTYINILKGRLPAELMDKERRGITVPSDKSLLKAY